MEHSKLGWEDVIQFEEVKALTGVDRGGFGTTGKQ